MKKKTPKQIEMVVHKGSQIHLYRSRNRQQNMQAKQMNHEIREAGKKQVENVTDAQKEMLTQD